MAWGAVVCMYLFIYFCNAFAQRAWIPYLYFFIFYLGAWRISHAVLADACGNQCMAKILKSSKRKATFFQLLTRNAGIFSREEAVHSNWRVPPSSGVGWTETEKILTFHCLWRRSQHLTVLTVYFPCHSQINRHLKSIQAPFHPYEPSLAFIFSYSMQPILSESQRALFLQFLGTWPQVFVILLVLFSSQ